MSRRLIAHALSGLGLTLALGACAAPQVGNPCPIPDNATEAQRAAALAICNAPIGSLPLPFSLRKDVDILFLIDNSPSMTPKQKALAQNIPLFIKEIEKTGVNYHVGIATSDVGADVALGQLWGGDIGTCDTFAGDDGVLQAKPCTKRAFSTTEGSNACATLCPDERFVPTDGRNYISKVNGVTNVPPKMVVGGDGKTVDEGPINAFQCMALVADQGCGVEAPLEGSLRALDGHRADNAGFLRSNSILAIIYITDEDDCSVQMAMRNQLNPKTRACDPTQPDDYDCYNIDYRCLARSVQCDQSMLQSGVKTNCKERQGNFLEPLKKYVDFFSKLRSPDRLLVSGIWTLPSALKGGPIEVAQNGTLPASTATLNRAGREKAGCFYAADNTVFGQAQFRLSQFTSMLPPDTSIPPSPTTLEVSICNIDQYPTALQTIALAIGKKGAASCLPVVPKVVNGKPNCVVGDVDANTPNGAPDVQFPVCSTNCCNAFASSATPTPADMAVQAACAAETTDACYCAVKSTVGQCGGTVVAGVWRKGGAAAPEGKQANFLCAGGG